MAKIPYRKGWHRVGETSWAYLQPDGGWGWSNAGLVADGGESLLVDTLFDLTLTREMLDAMERDTPASSPPTFVVNTHANGDHCYGNLLVSDAEIIASARCADEIPATPPAVLAGFLEAAPQLGTLGEYLEEIFGTFEFGDVELEPPSRTFDGELTLRVGARDVRLIEVGPAHTSGDVIVHVPDDGVIFTGDIIFHGGHPIAWTGPVANWIEACDRILALGAGTIVPGHGPVTGPDFVERFRGYFEYLTEQAKERFARGLTPAEAARDIPMGPYTDWSESERLVMNVTALYRDFGGEPDDDVVTMFTQMAELARENA